MTDLQALINRLIKDACDGRLSSWNRLAAEIVHNDLEPTELMDPELPDEVNTALWHLQYSWRQTKDYANSR